MALMPGVVKSRLASVVTGLVAMCGTCGALAPRVEASEPWPTQVQAVYRIEFNGFDVGSFEFNASVTGSSYTLTGDARLSALLGAFQWKGETRSAGTLAGDAPHPAGYTFDFAGTGKSGAIKMGFTGESVTSLAHVPPHVPQPGTIAVRETHLKGVLDPLSAVMALARTDAGGNPCARKLSIFDGKQRFDLALSFRRQEAVESRASGQPSVAFVCGVRYTPIAGHKISEETKAMSSSSGIEVSLRPVPSANLYVPHQITVPTGAGTARLISQQVRIVTRNEQIAFSQ